MSAICRTCMMVLTSGSQFFDIEEKEAYPRARASARLIKTKLEACVPELTLNIVKNSVICTDCVDALCTAYKFKIKCLEIEEIIYDYILQTESNSESLDIATVFNWSGKFDLYNPPPSPTAPTTPNGKKPGKSTRKVDLADLHRLEVSQACVNNQVINLDDDEVTPNYNLETLNRIIENSDTTVNCTPETLNKLIQNTDTSADSNLRIFNKIIEDAIADYKRRITPGNADVVVVEPQPEAGCSSWESPTSSSAPKNLKSVVESTKEAVVEVQPKTSGVNSRRQEVEEDVQLVSVTVAPPVVAVSQNNGVVGSSSSKKASDEGDVQFVSETTGCQSTSAGNDVEFVCETSILGTRIPKQPIAREPVIQIMRKSNAPKTVATKTKLCLVPRPTISQSVDTRTPGTRPVPTDEFEIVSVTKVKSVDLTGGSRTRPVPSPKVTPTVISVSQQKEAATMTDFSRPPRKFKQAGGNPAPATSIVTDLERNIPASASQKVSVTPDFAMTSNCLQSSAVVPANPVQFSIAPIRTKPVVVGMIGSVNVLMGSKPKVNAPCFTNGAATSPPNDLGESQNQVTPLIVSSRSIHEEDKITEAKKLISEARPEPTPSMVIPVIQNVISEFQEEPAAAPPPKKELEAAPPPAIIDLCDDTDNDLLVPIDFHVHPPIKLEELPTPAPPTQERSSSRLRHKTKVTYGRFSYLKAGERSTDTGTSVIKREPRESRWNEAVDFQRDGFRGFTPAEIFWSSSQCALDIKIENHELPEDFDCKSWNLGDWLKGEAQPKTEIISGLSCNYSQFCEFESQYEGFTMEKLYTEQLVALPECSVALTPLSAAELEKWRRTRSFKCRRCSFTCDSMVSMKMHRKAARQDGHKCGGGKLKRRERRNLTKENPAQENRAKKNRANKNLVKKNRAKTSRTKISRIEENGSPKNGTKKNQTKKKLSNLVRRVRLYKCTYCSYNSIYQSSLMFHMDIHGEQPPIKSGKASHNIYTCQLCEFSTIYKSSLKLHFRTHVGKTLYKCRHCYFHSFNKLLYKQHKKSHLGSWYECMECVFSSQFKKNLQYHYINCHFQYEPFECKLCRMEFPEQFLLVKHVFTHDFRKQQVYLEHNYSDVSKVFTHY